MGCAHSKTEEVATTNLSKDEIVAVPTETEPMSVEQLNVESETTVKEEPMSVEQLNVESETTVKEEPASIGNELEELKTQVDVPEERESSAKKAEELKTEADVSEEPVKEFYKVTGHEINGTGVVFYIVETVEGDISFKKRFRDFKTLVLELGNPKQFPALPSSGLGVLLRGKHNPSMIKNRELQFAVILNAIANDPNLIETQVFKKFVQ